MDTDQNYEMEEMLRVAYRSEIYIVARSIAIGLLLGALAIMYGPLTSALCAIFVTAMATMPGMHYGKRLARVNARKSILPKIDLSSNAGAP